MTDRRLPLPPLCVVAAVNDRQVLENCLRRSPDINSGAVPLKIMEGYANAGTAYNTALHSLEPGTIVVFAHQDVYLPRGYAELLLRRVDELEQVDPSWGVLAVSSLTSEGEFAGKVWATAWNRMFETSPLPTPIVTADELLLVLRAGTGLQFDEDLPSFHLFGTDIIQTALDRGRTSYAVDTPVIHHDKPVLKLGGDYRAAYRYMQRKWRRKLPLKTLITTVTRAGVALILDDLNIRWYRRGIRSRVAPTSDPSQIAEALGWNDGYARRAA